MKFVLFWKFLFMDQMESVVVSVRDTPMKTCKVLIEFI